MPENNNAYSPLTLAFLGDAVFGILVKERLVREANRPAGQLTALAAKLVCAPAQAQAFREIEPLLTEAEATVYRRGRNAHTGGVPKNATAAQYHCATGLEALFGWLYLRGETARLEELFAHIWAQHSSHGTAEYATEHSQ